MVFIRMAGMLLLLVPLLEYCGGMPMGIPMTSDDTMTMGTPFIPMGTMENEMKSMYGPHRYSHGHHQPGMTYAGTQNLPMDKNTELRGENQQTNAQGNTVPVEASEAETQENRNLEDSMDMNSHHTNGGRNVHMYLNQPLSLYSNRPMIIGDTMHMGTPVIIGEDRLIGVNIPMNTPMFTKSDRPMSVIIPMDTPMSMSASIPIGMTMQDEMSSIHGPFRYNQGLQQAGMVLGEILTGPLENNLKMNTVNQQKNAKRAPILTSEDVEEVEENRNLEGDVHMNSHHANGGMNVHMHLNHPTSTYGSRPMMQGVTVPMGSQMIMSNTRPMGLSMPMGTQMRIPMSMSMEENMPFMNGPQRHRHGLQQAGLTEEEIQTGPLGKKIQLSTVEQQKDTKRTTILTGDDVSEEEENRNMEGDLDMNSHHAHGGMNVHMHLNQPSHTYDNRPIMQELNMPTGIPMIMDVDRPIGVNMPMNSHTIIGATSPMGVSMPIFTSKHMGTLHPMNVMMQDDMSSSYRPYRHGQRLPLAGMTHEGILAGPLEKSVKLSTLDKQKNTKRNANQSESDEAGAQ